MSEECPRPHDEVFGMVQDQRTAVCLDCGECSGERRGDSIWHHEGRLNRIYLLLGELAKINNNINTDDEVDRKQRIHELINMELNHYKAWIGQEADHGQAKGQRNLKYRRLGRYFK